jgi:UDP-MurNAc hydroxylase
MKLEFVNHASLIFSYKDVNLMLDPWFEGLAFDKGWSLLSKSKFEMKDFERITHIWFSHEHPDHFSPSIISRIPSELKSKITILYHETNDKKIVDFCIKQGFKEVVELKENQAYVLQDDFKITSNEHTGGDSWCYLSTNEYGILNINDCVIRTEEESQELQNLVGRVDVLLTQFGYAHKIGNEGDDLMRRNAMEEKKVRIENQAAIFKPKFIIPFASFVFFCHEENKYMNLSNFMIDEMADLIKNKLGRKDVVMYPGDIWEVGNTTWNSSSAIERYNVDFANVSNFDFVKTLPVSQEELMKSGAEYGLKLIRKNPTAKRLLSKIGTTFYVNDLNKSYRFVGEKGIIEDSKNPTGCDVQLSSEALDYSFKNEWGAGTCHINARYFTTESGDVYKFHLLMNIANLNNEGKEYIWERPTFLSRLKHKLKFS